MACGGAILIASVGHAANGSVNCGTARFLKADSSSLDLGFDGIASDFGTPTSHKGCQFHLRLHCGHSRVNRDQAWQPRAKLW